MRRLVELVMSSWAPYLAWIDEQRDVMIERVIAWSALNSYSYNCAGLERMLRAVQAVVPALEGTVADRQLAPQLRIDQQGREQVCELGRMLTVTRRPMAPHRVLLGIHMDTVYPPGHSFQHAERVDPAVLRGPGALDAKSGLAIMLTALEAFERSPVAERLGWDLFVNPDEEIGSPGSTPWLTEHARDFDLGLVFEPAFDDGALVSARQGSGQLAVVVHGRSAHAGREPQKGRNAIHALAELILEVSRWHAPAENVLVNVGRVAGGTADNVVPDLAVAHINIRVRTPEQGHAVMARLHALAEAFSARDGFRVELHGSIARPPKMLDEPTLVLLQSLAQCARDEGCELAWRPSGGASDGNTLSAVGLPTVDSLGGRGGGMHSLDEWVSVHSLTERARLVALFLMRLAAGELPWPRRGSATAERP
jgi:glutamate carboxypeptidase